MWSSLAIDHLKITVWKCTGSQWRTSPCRCKLGMRPRPRAATMFWLIVPVRAGHFIPTCTSAYHPYVPQQTGAHTATPMRVAAHAQRGALSAHGHTQTHSRGHHKSTQTKTPSSARPHVLQQFMLRQSGSAPRYSLLLMSESTTRSDGWTSCSLYCLKPSSFPPAVALCLHLGGESVMINALSGGISGREPGVSAEVLRSYCGDSVAETPHCGATLKNNCAKIKKSERSHTPLCVLCRVLKMD